MTNEYIDAIFVMDYSNYGGGHQWSNLPDDLWWKLASNLDLLMIDGVSFQSITTTEQLPEYVTNKCEFHFKFTTKYEPYHAESSSEVAVFSLTNNIRKLLLSEEFDQWNRANDQLPFDELCLFRKQKRCGDVLSHWMNSNLCWQLSRKSAESNTLG